MVVGENKTLHPSNGSWVTGCVAKCLVQSREWKAPFRARSQSVLRIIFLSSQRFLDSPTNWKTPYRSPVIKFSWSIFFSSFWKQSTAVPPSLTIKTQKIVPFLRLIYGNRLLTTNPSSNGWKECQAFDFATTKERLSPHLLRGYSYLIVYHICTFKMICD